MAAADPLARYNAKRDFTRTAEPAGTLAKGHGNSFVVQKHDATRLHWDFRLEVDGVLKSWAVTRGPSLDPNEKRLAVRTEDHPLDYGSFEGTIPSGEYGGGTVMLWDRGTWSPIKGKSAKDLDAGHLHFVLEGERMRGEWLLIRLKPRAKEKRENWLLRKIGDAEAGGTDTLVETALTSVSSGRTMQEIAEGKAPKKRKPVRKKATKSATLPAFTEPQLCTLVDAVPTGSAWLHEVKYDGYRALIAVAGGTAKVFTRNGLDWSDKFLGIAEAAATLDVTSALIDGEIVAFKDGRPDFSTLKDAISSGGDMTMFAFDLLAQDGEDLSALPTTTRKARLQAIIGDDARLHYAEHVVGSGEQLLDGMCAEGLEGVVSKRADAPYRAGRTSDWLKIKCTRRQEFVIVGWLPSDKKRGFKSLLLGVHEDGKLRYAGKVGTGFTQALMTELRAKLDTRARKTAPVDAPRATVRGAQWVKPDLVAEIAFTETTPDGLLRHPSFLGLRGDKSAREVVLEQPQSVAETPAPNVAITNRNRVIDPDAEVTKGDLADYYAAVAAIMLPWSGHRPISLVRCPQGRANQCFFQKHDAGSFGDAVHKVAIPEKDGGSEEYLWVDDAAGLLTCVQMGTIEFHGWGSRVDALERPDRMIFDLDPDEGLAFADTKKAAEFVRDQLGEIGLASFPLLSGGKGVHVVVPLTPQAEWPAVRDFAERFAKALAQADPDRFVATMSKAKRKGRIFIDYLRNQRGSTAIMPYSARARAGAPVAAPVTWSELRDLDTAANWHVGDAAELIARANAPALSGWGVSDQVLPHL
ncbi:DNA ligase D [Sphingomonas sp. HHU CXW]|uniref:DNA ligase (ATP) n=1 Tax=Sphingomonas hominis TaxID=2741495 RepID=A0ABX2JII6_9SPHN|nr:DNA ligase D [Sphingomonas hominis]NTS65416.1 DNA ligase D [Sphingomonas hominis]